MLREGDAVVGDTICSKLTDFDFFNKFEDDFDDKNVN